MKRKDYSVLINSIFKITILCISTKAFANSNICSSVYFNKGKKMVTRMDFENIYLYRQNIGIDLYNLSFKKKEHPSTVIEIGPGTGEVFKSFLTQKNVPSFLMYFIEPDRSQKEKLLQYGSNVDVITNTLEQSFQNNMFPQNVDTVIANFSLHWVTNVNKYFDQIYQHLNKNGIFSFSNTDTSRSFWTEIDVQVQNKFPGCSLYNIEKSHSMNISDWENLTINSGFNILYKKEYVGTASVFANARVAFDNFKQTVGTNYLKLSSEFTQKQVEDYVIHLLESRTNSDGRLKIKASGFAIVGEKK